MKTSVRIVSLVNFTTSERKTVMDAAPLWATVKSSMTWKEFILNHRYKNEKGVWVKGFAYTNLTNEEIYKFDMEGAEIGDGRTVDYEWELYLTMQDTLKNEIGHTYPSKLMIYFNRKYLGKAEPPYWTGRFEHEKLHQVGIHHPAKSTSLRKYSAPYALGYEMERQAKILWKNQTPIKNVAVTFSQKSIPSIA